MVRMSPSAPCAYILHPEMAATWETAKSIATDTTGQISGTADRRRERLPDSGLGESRTGFRKGRTNKNRTASCWAVRFRS
jgi:hypothetical protein